MEAPPLSLPDLAGKIFEIKKIQKPVILFFFASWSKSCQSELQDLQELFRDHQKIEIIGVALDRKIKPLKEFLNENHISFTILHDKKLLTLDRYQVVIIPTTFCLDQNGYLEKIFVDYDQNVKVALKDWAQKFVKEDE
ncbi:MAG: TlpA family protein disulfide reductase, partial [Candidatus Margulisiibacteriota bacterium]